MADKELLEFLKRSCLFSNFNADELKSVLRSTKQRKFLAGSTIVKRGDMGGVGFYLVIDGLVEVRKGERRLAVLGPGEFFGEMVLLLDKETPRSADVISKEDTNCLILTRWNFLSLIKTHPDMAIKMLGELAHRLSETHQSLSE